MSVTLEDDVVRLSGDCRVEEAEPLTGLLQAGRRAVDLSQCRQAHSAVIQVLLAFRPAIAAEPADPWLRDILRAAELRPPEDHHDTSPPAR